MPHSLLPYRPERDVYRLLSIEPTADERQVELAWRRLARTFHPDRNQSTRANEEMQVVNAVRQLLTDPVSRATYDGQRRRYLRFIGARPPDAVSAIPVGPAPRVESVATSWADRVRAFFTTALASVLELRAARCPGCGLAAERSHRYCARCGTRIRPLEKLSGR